MAINYTWNVSTVDVKEIDGNADTVFNVHWTLTGTDDANNDADGNPQAATVYGTIGLDTEDLSDFIAFADLTVSDVQGWVEAAMGEEEVQAKKDSLNATIAELVTPTVQTKQVG
tara:strand:- start:415 stop:756 length:342 start_codon:yes stop_codon:yes gene_type:complete